MAIDFSQLEDQGLAKSLSTSHHPFKKDFRQKKFQYFFTT
jgi:hypothetical protein